MTYHRGDQPKIHQEDTHRLVFAALIRDRILPNKQDFDGEFVTIDTPIKNPRCGYNKETVQHAQTERARTCKPLLTYGEQGIHQQQQNIMERIPE